MSNPFFRFFTKLFTYQPQDSYHFTLPETENGASSPPTTPENSYQQKQIKDKISLSLEDNIAYLKVKYNSLLNSDIILREFSLTVYGKTYRALLFYIDRHD